MRTRRLPVSGGDGDADEDEEEAGKVGTKIYRLALGV
jgi:hypothetical protein